MADVDYKAAAARAREQLERQRPAMEKAWGGDRRVARERCRRWCEMGLERLSAEYLNILAQHAGCIWSRAAGGGICSASRKSGKRRSGCSEAQTKRYMHPCQGLS
jgi:hypothetical protein